MGLEDLQTVSMGLEDFQWVWRTPIATKSGSMGLEDLQSVSMVLEDL